MKILFINQYYWPHVIGGAELSVQVLAEELAAKGHEIVVVTLAQTDHHQTRVINGVKVHYVAVNNALSHANHSSRTFVTKVAWHFWIAINPKMMTILKRILVDEKPDLVHTNILAGFSVRAWRLARQLGIPIIHTLRDYYLICPRGTMFKSGRNCAYQCRSCYFYTTARRHLAAYPTAVIAISRNILERHQHLGYFNTTPMRRVIFSAYKAPRIASDPNTTHSDALRLGFLGRIHPTKGVETLLSAVSDLPQHELSLKIAGTGMQTYIEFLKAEYAPRNVEFLGFIKPETLFDKIDLLVVPSSFEEPLGRVVFEAYAHGVPVLGSNRGGISEIIEPGVTGWTFDPDEKYGLSSALQRLTRTPDAIRSLRHQCLRKARDFAPARIAEQSLELYEQVLECGGRPITKRDNAGS